MTAILEIDLDAIADNWRALDAMHEGATAAVIKADAYGLGAARVAPKLRAAGCENFFVAQLGEAMAVRRLIPRALLAVLNGLGPNEAKIFAAEGITPVLGSLAEIALWRAEAARLAEQLPAILHIDTGMARLGLSAAELGVLHQDGSLLDGLRVDYVMTHLVSADNPGDPRNLVQAAKFAAACRQFPETCTSFANSSGMFLGEAFGSDLARPGAAMYGIHPQPKAGGKNPMRDVVRLRAPILQIRDVEAGETVGYDGYWTAGRASKIAVLGVGYADGLHRALSNTGSAWFDGAKIPLVGRVSMDLTTYDVTDVPAQPGDMIELLGPAHGPDALAMEAGTNGYEILTSLGRRYQRQYIGV